jgi:hypothetical protein
MRLPQTSTILILGKECTVNITPEVDDDDDGEYDVETNTISIHSDVPKKDHQDLLIHEALHGLFDISGLDRDINLAQEHIIIQGVIRLLNDNFKPLVLKKQTK